MARRPGAAASAAGVCYRAPEAPRAPGGVTWPTPWPPSATGAVGSGTPVSMRIRQICASRGRELLDPRDVFVHPAVQELLRFAIGNVARVVEETFLVLQVSLGLSERRHVEVSEDGAQMQLRDRRADRAGGHADDAGRLARPGTLPIGPRGMIEGVLEHAGKRAIVFGSHEHHRVDRAKVALESLNLGRLRPIVVLVVQRKVADAQLLEGEVRRREFDQRDREFSIERILPEASDDVTNLPGHSRLLFALDHLRLDDAFCRKSAPPAGLCPATEPLHKYMSAETPRTPRCTSAPCG